MLLWSFSTLEFSSGYKVGCHLQVFCNSCARTATCWLLSLWQPAVICCHCDGHLSVIVAMTATCWLLSLWQPPVGYCHCDSHLLVIFTVTATRWLLSMWQPPICYCHHDSHLFAIVTMPATWWLLSLTVSCQLLSPWQPPVSYVIVQVMARWMCLFMLPPLM